MSIQANELRIGNLILDNISNKIEKVDYLTIKIVINEEDIYEPIPLTEEWLLKFGFVKYQWMNGYFINTFFGDLMIQLHKTEIHLFFTKVSYDSQGMKFYGRKFINNKTSFTHCKYIHQLQNLYFFLCGEELTIKL